MKKGYLSKKRSTRYCLIKSTKKSHKMDSDHDSVADRLNDYQFRWKLWVGLGALGAVVALSNPQAIKTLKPLAALEML